MSLSLVGKVEDLEHSLQFQDKRYKHLKKGIEEAAEWHLGKSLAGSGIVSSEGWAAERRMGGEAVGVVIMGTDTDTGEGRESGWVASEGD